MATRRVSVIEDLDSSQCDIAQRRNPIEAKYTNDDDTTMSEERPTTIDNRREIRILSTAPFVNENVEAVFESFCKSRDFRIEFDEETYKKSRTKKFLLHAVNATLTSSSSVFKSSWLEISWCESLVKNNNNRQMWMEMVQSTSFFASMDSTKNEFEISSISFGAFRESGTFIDHWNYRTEELKSALALFEYDSKTVAVTLRSKNNKINKLETAFEDLYKCILVTVFSDLEANVYFFLKCPPKLYDGTSSETHCKEDILKLVERNNESYITIDDNNLRKDNLKRAVNFETCSKDIIGSSNVLNIELSFANAAKFEQLLSRMRSNKFQIFYASPKIKQLNACEMLSYPLLKTFDATYAWFCLLSRGFKVTDQLSEELIEYVKLQTDRVADIEEVIFNVIDIIDEQCICSLKDTFEQEFRKYETKADRSAANEEVYSPKKDVKISRLILTPTTKRGIRGEQTACNRITRTYPSDRFLTVLIRDENGQLLTTSSSSNKQTVEVIRGFLSDGFQIGDRHYRYLGSSNSQLREHSVWMFANTESYTVEIIRNDIGDLRNERCVATYIARLGQFFSTSQETIIINDDGWKVIADIKNEKYNFSDGIGQIFASLAEQVTNELGPTHSLLRKPTPSAFQIRFGGCKGVVALNPMLTGEQLLIRESMNKFKSSHRKLEVLEFTKPSRLYLNRQVIALLSGLGVPDSAFFALQDAMLHKLADIFLNESEAGDHMAKVHFKTSLAKLQDNGLILTMEPFFRSLLKLRYQKKLQTLLEKTKIEIPDNKGRFLMGTLDETDSLNYGEVFVQYSDSVDKPDSDTCILESMVVVAKNPCLHPGDIRKFQAVNIPRLSHMIDCIVFPAKLPRPHPDEMSGSDLDGDKYFVCWEETLIPETDNKDPMDYEPGNKLEVANEITEADMINFVCEFVQSPQLGVINNAHVVHADAQPEGINSEECLKLAQMHSCAVDFPKTGQCPVMPPKLRPQRYPHYMLKLDKPVYTSKHIIANLFDQCQAIDRALYYETSTHMELDPDLIIPGHEDYLESANVLKNTYIEKIQALLNRFDLKNELEAWTGQISSTYKRPGSHDIGEQVEEIMMNIIGTMKTMFKDEVEKSTQKDRLNSTSICIEKMMASAVYYVTYESASSESDKNKMLGLPWIFSDLLSLIKHSNVENRQVTFPTAARTQSKSVLEKLSTDIADKICSYQFEPSRMRLEIYSQICQLIEEKQISVKVILFGSSVTMLLNDSSSLDVVILSSDSTCLSNKDFKEVVLIIAHKIGAKQPQKIHLYHDQKKVFLISENGIKVNLFTDANYLRRTACIVAFMVKSKWLVPCIKAIIAWSHSDKNKRLFRSENKSLLTTEELVFMFCQVMIKVTPSVKAISENEINFMIKLFIKGHFNNCPLETCEHINKLIDANYETHTINKSQYAEMIISFFKHYGSKRNDCLKLFNNVPDLSRPAENVKLFCLKMEQCLLLSDRMTQAYHLFVHASCLDEFLINEKQGNDQLQISLPCQAASYIAFSRIYQQNIMKKESEAQSLAIRLKKFRNGTSGLILEAWGTSRALSIVNQDVQDLIKTSISMTKEGNALPRVVGKESYNVVFEGCPSEDADLNLESYFGPWQPGGKNSTMHVPRILSPNLDLDFDYCHFFEVFQEQIRFIKQNHNSETFGDLQMVISYGTYYIKNFDNKGKPLATVKEFCNEVQRQNNSSNKNLVQIQDTNSLEVGPTLRGDHAYNQRGRKAVKPKSPKSMLNKFGSACTSMPKSKHLELETDSAIKTTFKPSGTANEPKLYTYLKSQNFKMTKQFEEYRVSVKLKMLGQSASKSLVSGKLVLNKDFSFHRLQLPETKWFTVDTIKSFEEGASSNKKFDDIRFKVDSMIYRSNAVVLEQLDCKDLLLDANRILVKGKNKVIEVDEQYKNRINFLRHKHLDVYKCQNKPHDLEMLEDGFFRHITIHVNHGDEYACRNGKCIPADLNRVEVTAWMPLPDLGELLQSDELCEKFSKFVWKFGLKLGESIK